MSEKKDTVHQIMISVIDEICENYCKYESQLLGTDPGADPDMLEEMLYDQYCRNCPLNRLC